MIYLKLFLEFFKIGIFTFGGGYAMIPIIEESVLKNNWLTENDFYNFIGICESTPGPIAVNMATYVGSSQAGFIGAFIATIGVVLPAFIIIVLIASIMKNIMKNKYVNRALYTIKAVVLGLILSTGLLLTFKECSLYPNNFSINYISILIFISLIVIYFIVLKFFKKKIGSIYIILISAILGVIFCIILK